MSIDYSWHNEEMEKPQFLTRLRLKEGEAARITFLPNSLDVGRSHWIGAENDRRQYRCISQSGERVRFCCETEEGISRLHAVALVVAYGNINNKTAKFNSLPTVNDLSVQFVDLTPHHFKTVKALVPEGQDLSVFDLDVRMAKGDDRRISFNLLALKASYTQRPELLAFVQTETARWRPSLVEQLGKVMNEASWKALLSGKHAPEPTLDDLEFERLDKPVAPAVVAAATDLPGVPLDFSPVARDEDIPF